MNMLLKSSAVVAAATALPALAKPATVASPIAPVPAAAISTEPTRIAKLWARRNAIRDQARAAYRIVHQIERKAWRRAGPIDPAIAYSAKNDRLGLNRHGWDRTPYIDPLRIQAELRNSDRAAREAAMWRGRPFVPSKRQILHEKRLTALLDISREYDAKVRAIRDAHGFHEANLKAEELVRRQGNIECQIMKKRSLSIGDLQIKFAIAGVDDCDYDHAEIARRDLRRMMQHPALAQAFAEA